MSGASRPACYVTRRGKSILPPGLIYCRDAMDAATEVDALVLITEWADHRLFRGAAARGGGARHGRWRKIDESTDDRHVKRERHVPFRILV
jgi:hypothetical protein